MGLFEERALEFEIAGLKQQIMDLKDQLADSVAATRCFVRQFQIEGGIVTAEDVARWPWIAQWIMKENDE